jgi:hypothetical protein
VVSHQVLRRSLKIASDNAQAGVDAATTIAARVTGLMSAGGSQDAKAREAHRMVGEKVAAAVEGVIAVQAAWNAFFVKAAYAGVAAPHEMSLALVEVADAAAGPARSKARANARRLVGVGAVP